MSDHHGARANAPARRREAGSRRPARADAEPLVVVVDDPVALAERCWDAGFTVRVQDGPAGAVSLFVSDPFGRVIALLGRTTTTRPSVSAAGEE